MDLPAKRRGGRREVTDARCNPQTRPLYRNFPTTYTSAAMANTHFPNAAPIA